MRCWSRMDWRRARMANRGCRRRGRASRSCRLAGRAEVCAFRCLRQSSQLNRDELRPNAIVFMNFTMQSRRVDFVARRAGSQRAG